MKGTRLISLRCEFVAAVPAGHPGASAVTAKRVVGREACVRIRKLGVLFADPAVRAEAGHGLRFITESIARSSASRVRRVSKDVPHLPHMTRLPAVSSGSAMRRSSG